jgi:hypothetical protein
LRSAAVSLSDLVLNCFFKSASADPCSASCMIRYKLGLTEEDKGEAKSNRVR